MSKKTKTPAPNSKGGGTGPTTEPVTVEITEPGQGQPAGHSIQFLRRDNPKNKDTAAFTKFAALVDWAKSGYTVGRMKSIAHATLGKGWVGSEITWGLKKGFFKLVPKRPKDPFVGAPKTA